MLKRLHLRNFTVFADAEFEFGDGLNVLVGANGTGKTHVLKVGYVVDLVRDSIKNKGIKLAEAELISKHSNEQYPDWGVKLILNLADVFLVKGFDVLSRRGFLQEKSVVNVEFAINADEKVDFEFGRVEAKEYLNVTEALLKEDSSSKPVFIPAKEALTLGWLLSFYERFRIPIDKTYPNILSLLSGPPLRQPEPAHIVEKLAQLIGGKVEEEGGHFYLAAPDQPRLEMNLVAEGMRKFATLYKLLANGTLTPETTLFWDEPEANLNPALLKDMAVVLTDLAEGGFQIILATHSLFLMRELHILAQQRKKPVRYFGLYASEEGDVRVERQDDLMQLQHLVALDAELKQTFDFEAALDDEYAGN